MKKLILFTILSLITGFIFFDSCSNLYHFIRSENIDGNKWVCGTGFDVVITPKAGTSWSPKFGEEDMVLYTGSILEEDIPY